MTQNPAKLQPEGLRTLRAYQLAKQLAHQIHHSLKEKHLDGSWDRTYTAAQEEQEAYDV